VIGPEDIQDGWKECVEKLYGGSNRPVTLKTEKEYLVEENNLRPIIPDSETEKALRKIKTSDEVGIDNFSSELLKNLSVNRRKLFF
jgi:hypothetical protein